MLFEILNNIFIQIQKEKLHSKIIQLEKQLDTRQKLELEIQQLKGSLSVLKHIEDDDDVEVLKRVDDLHMGLREKEQALQDLESLNQTLIIKERKSNDELQEARKELINVSTFPDISSLSSLLIHYINLEDHLCKVCQVSNSLILELFGPLYMCLCVSVYIYIYGIPLPLFFSIWSMVLNIIMDTRPSCHCD
jgi:hypothetical protein